MKLQGFGAQTTPTPTIFNIRNSRRLWEFHVLIHTLSRNQHLVDAFPFLDGNMIFSFSPFDGKLQ